MMKESVNAVGRLLLVFVVVMVLMGPFGGFGVGYPTGSLFSGIEVVVLGCLLALVGRSRLQERFRDAL